jgi:hypothetical protein
MAGMKVRLSCSDSSRVEEMAGPGPLAPILHNSYLDEEARTVCMVFVKSGLTGKPPPIPYVGR